MPEKNVKEVLDYLLPLMEEDSELFLTEVEILVPKINMGKIQKFYRGEYIPLIKRISEIRGENNNFIY